jgi:hypothetical protein
MGSVALWLVAKIFNVNIGNMTMEAHSELLIIRED